MDNHQTVTTTLPLQLAATVIHHTSNTVNQEKLLNDIKEFEERNIEYTGLQETFRIILKLMETEFPIDTDKLRETLGRGRWNGLRSFVWNFWDTNMTADIAYICKQLFVNIVLKSPEFGNRDSLISNLVNRKSDSVHSVLFGKTTTFSVYNLTNSYKTSHGYITLGESGIKYEQSDEASYSKPSSRPLHSMCDTRMSSSTIIPVDLMSHTLMVSSTTRSRRG